MTIDVSASLTREFIIMNAGDNNRLYSYLSGKKTDDVATQDYQSLSEHDRTYHPGGYKNGDKCKVRDALRKSDVPDSVVEKALRMRDRVESRRDIEGKIGSILGGFVKWDESESPENNGTMSFVVRPENAEKYADDPGMYKFVLERELDKMGYSASVSSSGVPGGKYAGFEFSGNVRRLRPEQLLSRAKARKPVRIGRTWEYDYETYNNSEDAMSAWRNDLKKYGRLVKGAAAEDAKVGITEYGTPTLHGVSSQDADVNLQPLALVNNLGKYKNEHWKNPRTPHYLADRYLRTVLATEGGTGAGVAKAKTLAEHDKRFHDGQYDESKGTCKFREAMKREDDADEVVSTKKPSGKYPYTAPGQKGVNLEAHIGPGNQDADADEVVSTKKPSGKYPYTAPGQKGVNLEAHIGPGNQDADADESGFGYPDAKKATRDDVSDVEREPPKSPEEYRNRMDWFEGVEELADDDASNEAREAGESMFYEYAKVFDPEAWASHVDHKAAKEYGISYDGIGKLRKAFEDHMIYSMSTYEKRSDNRYHDRSWTHEDYEKMNDLSQKYRDVFYELTRNLSAKQRVALEKDLGLDITAVDIVGMKNKNTGLTSYFGQLDNAKFINSLMKSRYKDFDAA